LLTCCQEREIEKVNAFYLQKEAEFSLRLKTLLDKKRIIQARIAAGSKISASFATLVEGFQQFDNDLNKLQQFVEVNETAISKILKKWDKTSKSRTKELYLQRAVEIQPCFRRDVLRDLSDRSTTARLDLEGWAEGENIQQDARPADRTIGQRIGTDESDVDLQILQAAAAGNLATLREWIVRLGAAPNAKERFTRIFLASISDSADEAISLLLETNLIDIHAEDDVNERNCLHEAAIYGKDYVLNYGLANGVDLSRHDVYGRIPLHYACLKGRVTMAQTLIERGPTTVNNKDHDNFTPLIHSIVRHKIACVEQLLSHHAQIDPTSDGEHIPLNLACQHGSIEVAKLLLQRNARLLPDAEGLYPQHLVARSGQSSELLLLLKDHGGDLNQKDKLYQWTPLFHAASEGRVNCLRTLLENGADVQALDEKGLSAMYYATWEGHLECMDLLWERSSRRHDNGSQTIRAVGALTPLHSQSLPLPMDLSTPQQSGEIDGIPDLSLPPPIIPLRRYGHNFLDSKTYVAINFSRGAKSIKFFNEGRYPAARITISSKLSDLIPRNIMLPIQDDTKSVSFQIDSLESFAVDFEIFPTFGSKVIAKSVALPDVFRAVESSSGTCCLPLFDPRLRAVGQIHFSFQVIKPFSGEPLEITHFATYWKATSALDDRSGLITGSSLSGDYLQLVIQVTRDNIPIVYPTYCITRGGMDISIGNLTYTSLKDAGLVDERKLADMQTIGVDISALHTLLGSSLLPVKDILENLQTSIHVNLQVPYPSAIEEYTLRLGPTIDINTFTDVILKIVFDHARASKIQNPDFMRSIVFTSPNPQVCSAFNWKQPNFPVLVCNDLGSARHVREKAMGVPAEVRAPLSIKESARLAQNNNFMGLTCRSRILEMVPALIETIKEAGLVLVVDTTDEPANEDNARWMLMPEGVNGIMKSNGILRFNETIDM
jgi:CDK inhibitor PHO81